MVPLYTKKRDLPTYPERPHPPGATTPVATEPYCTGYSSDREDRYKQGAVPRPRARRRASPTASMNIGSASLVEARYTEDGRPEFDAADFKELEARARGPDVLTGEEMAMAMERKGEGNQSFNNGEIENALAAYNKALEIFADRRGDATQRVDKSKLLANRAECLLRLERWEAASKSATEALRCDVKNGKARFRRARAHAALGGENHLVDALVDLEQLRLDSENGELGKAEKKLLREVKMMQEELKGVRKKDAGGLRKAFATGKAGLSSKADAMGDEAAPVALPDLSESGVDCEAAHSAAADWMLRPALHRPEDTTLRYAWLIDCYRTRVDDDCAPGRTPHGLCAPSSSAASILLDFLIFSRLAVARGVIPSGAANGLPAWDWGDFLGEASKMLCKAFNPEKCHAEYRYGEEMGRGERMRTLASLLYDNAPAGGPAREPSTEAVRRETVESCWRDGGPSEEDPRCRRHMLTFDLNQSIFEKVGGTYPWRALLASLGQALGQRGTTVSGE